MHVQKVIPSMTGRRRIATATITRPPPTEIVESSLFISGVEVTITITTVYIVFLSLHTMQHRWFVFNFFCQHVPFQFA